MKQSPMFLHAAESFEHGLQHYLDASTSSRKFALLHVDQAIELFLKEKTVRLGKSIYKNDGTTLNLHEVFKSLDDLSIPEKPRLEELHDLRNVVQHKGLTPDIASTQFYIEMGYKFVKRFLEEELDTPITEILSREYRALMEIKPFPLQQKNEVLEALRKAQKEIEPSQKIIEGYTVLNRAVIALNLTESDVEKLSIRKTIRSVAKKLGADDYVVKKHLDTIMQIRNNVVHTDYKATNEDAMNFLSAIDDLLKLSGCI
jgi:hypothetical protein